MGAILTLDATPGSELMPTFMVVREAPTAVVDQIESRRMVAVTTLDGVMRWLVGRTIVMVEPDEDDEPRPITRRGHQ